MGQSPAMKNRDYILFLISLFTSKLAYFMMVVAVNWQLYQLTKSPLSLGLLGLFNFIPILLMSFFSGIIADIFNRKKILFLVILFSMLNSLALALLTTKELINPLLIYLLVSFNSTYYSFEAPARQSMLPTLVPRKSFPKAVSINNMVFHSTNFIGPAAAGFIIAFSGVSGVYFINVGVFVAALISLLFMSPAVRNVVRPKFNFLEIKQGLVFVFKSPLIFSSMMIDFLATFFASATTLMPIFAVDILKVGPSQMGFLYAAPSAGAIIAGLIFTFLHKIKNQGRVLIYSVLLYGAATVSFALSRNYYLSLFFISITGAADMISAVIRNIVRQLSTPDHLRGRMTAVNMVFYNGGPQLGEAEAGFTAHLFGTPASVALGGLATIAITLYIAKKTPQLLNYKEKDVD